MSIHVAIERMRKSFGPGLEAVVASRAAPLASLLEGISDVQCTPEEFVGAAAELSTEQARLLLTATLHRSMAYSTELLSLEEAKSIAAEFVESAGQNARFYSTCEASDEFSGIGGWSIMVTGHTFESILYCVGEQESALIAVMEED